MAGLEREVQRGGPRLSFRELPPIWGEGRILSEYLSLRRDPVFHGRGVVRGRGAPVLLIPGFLAGDRTLAVMSAWLQRMGYWPRPAGIRLNVLRSELLLKGLRRRLLETFLSSHRRVTVIGHSRGGMLGKVLGDRHPELVRQVIALGSPLGNPFDVHPVTLAGVQAARVLNFVRHPYTGEGRFLNELATEPRVPVTSIYSRSDGVVRWQTCLGPGMNCREVRGSHVGLAVNREVYRLLARLLVA